jgi:hypothetical protein
VTGENSNFLASIWLNERKLWPEEHTVSQGASSHDLNVKVMEDAFLTFLVSQKAPSRTADSCTPGKVSWNPVITYLPGGNSSAVWRPNPAGVQNLALNKYARSKALVSSYRPFDAVDGDLTTAFAIHADDPISSGEDWFAVDLDKTCLIDRYVLICQSHNPLYLPKRFSVQRSDDGLVWSDVESSAKLTGEHSMVDCIPLIRVQRDVPAFRARYVRIYFPDGKPFVINGFELYLARGESSR